jgi:putative addiction module antidote
MPNSEIDTLTVTQMGNSLAVLLSREIISRLGVKKGDKLFLIKTRDGYRLTPYDPQFENQMNVARKIMQKRRNALRQLAK